MTMHEQRQDILRVVTNCVRHVNQHNVPLKESLSMLCNTVVQVLEHGLHESTSVDAWGFVKAIDWLKPGQGTAAVKHAQRIGSSNTEYLASFLRCALINGCLVSFLEALTSDVHHIKSCYVHDALLSTDGDRALLLHILANLHGIDFGELQSEASFVNLEQQQQQQQQQTKLQLFDEPNPVQIFGDSIGRTQIPLTNEQLAAVVLPKKCAVVGNKESKIYDNTKVKPKRKKLKNFRVPAIADLDAVHMASPSSPPITSKISSNVLPYLSPSMMLPQYNHERDAPQIAAAERALGISNEPEVLLMDEENMTQKTSSFLSSPSLPCSISTQSLTLSSPSPEDIRNLEDVSPEDIKNLEEISPEDIRNLEEVTPKDSADSNELAIVVDSSNIEFGDRSAFGDSFEESNDNISCGIVMSNDSEEALKRMTSPSFQTINELERENSHFAVSEELISALEEVNYVDDLDYQERQLYDYSKSPDIVPTKVGSSSSPFSSPVHQAEQLLVDTPLSQKVPVPIEALSLVIASSKISCDDGDGFVDGNGTGQSSENDYRTDNDIVVDVMAVDSDDDDEILELRMKLQEHRDRRRQSNRSLHAQSKKADEVLMNASDEYFAGKQSIDGDMGEHMGALTCSLNSLRFPGFAKKRDFPLSEVSLHSEKGAQVGLEYNYSTDEMLEDPDDRSLRLFLASREARENKRITELRKAPITRRLEEAAYSSTTDTTTQCPVSSASSTTESSASDGDLRSQHNRRRKSFTHSVFSDGCDPRYEENSAASVARGLLQGVSSQQCQVASVNVKNEDTKAMFTSHLPKSDVNMSTGTMLNDEDRKYNLTATDIIAYYSSSSKDVNDSFSSRAGEEGDAQSESFLSRSSPQRSLSEAREHSLSVADAGGSQIRGDDQWAPPRAQIIFNIHTTGKRSEMVARQNFRCAGCGIVVQSDTIKYLRYCSYTGKYFCSICHSNMSAIVPALVLHRWEFKKHAVSDFARNLLSRIYCEPLFDITTINARLYKKVRALDAVRALRMQLYYLKDFLRTCRTGGKLLRMLRERSYFINDVDIYSLRDLVEVAEGTLLSFLQQTTRTIMSHVEECELCRAKGFCCEYCKSEEIFYPFELVKAIQCNSCRSFFHRKCYNVNTCPKCQRMHIRSSIQERQ